MAIFKQHEFYPKCEAVGNPKEGAAFVMRCHIAERIGDKKFESDTPVELVVDPNSRKVMVSNTGGASSRQLDLLVKYVERNLVR